MLSLLAGVLLLFVVTIILGKTFYYLFSRHSALGITEFALTGTAIANTYFVTYSFFGRTDYLALLGLIVICVLLSGFLYWKNELHLAIKPALISFQLPVLIFIVFLASYFPQNYDSGLYHIQSIKWIENFAVVPGLGNLHGRFAFNPAIFNLMAGFSLKDIFNQSLFVVNPFLTALYFNFLVTVLWKHKSGPLNVFCFLLLTGLASIVFVFSRVESPTPDLAANLIPICLILKYVDLMYATSEDELPFRLSKDNLLFFVFLSVYAITIKLSTITFMLLSVVLLWNYRKDLSWKSLLWVTLPPLLIVVPWLIRNYYLSGYLVYPVSAINIFNPDWKIPLSSVMDEQRSICNFAKIQGPDYAKAGGMSLFEWFPIWFKQLSGQQTFLFVLATISPFSILLAYIISRKLSPRTINVLLLWFVTFSGVVFWFFTAPDIRFGFSSLLLSGLVFLLLLDIKWKWIPVFLSLPLLFIIPAPFSSKALLPSLISLVIWATIHYLKPKSKILQYWTFFTFAAIVCSICYRYIKPKKQYFFSEMMIRPSRVDSSREAGGAPIDGIKYSFRNVGGRKLILPINDDRCFDQPLPCSPFSDQFEMRGSSLQDGFRSVK